MRILTSPETYRLEPGNAWQRLKTRVRKPKELAVLIEVAAWREREAQARDVPRGRVLKDEVIADIAVQAPTSSDKLKHLRSLPKGFERSRWSATRKCCRARRACKWRLTAARWSNSSKCCCA